MNFEHDRAADWDWLSKWQPNVIRYMGGGNWSDPNSFDVNRVRRIHETCPDATILLRCWEIDDNNFQAHDAMVQDPQGTAVHQVMWWSKVFDNANRAGVPRDRLMAGLNNETGPEKDGPLFVYTRQALATGTQHDVRLGVFVFSTGRPSLPGEGQYTIDTFSELDAAILDNDGAVVLHEYLQPEGMYAVWTDAQGNERKDYTYLIGRHTRWNIKSPIIIGEWGIDGILWNRHPDPKYGNSGWRNFKAEWPPNRYADEYVECVRQASDNVIGICPFISDFSDHKWQSFDLLDAYGAFLARKDLCVKTSTTTPPVDVHLPQVGKGPQPAQPIAYVVVPAGANIRSAPNADTAAILTAVPYGEAVRILGVEQDNWLRVRYGEFTGYMHAQLIGLEAPDADPVPVVPEPSAPSNEQEAWQRSRTFIKKWEGGYQNVHNDKGNWTGCAVGKGELKGTKYGISACSYPHLDIKNLTEAQADEIYYTDYWQRSGANKLPWPMCLLVLDTAVLHGVGTAQKWVRDFGPNPYLFAARRLESYTKQDNFDFWGKAWTLRVADLLEEMAR